ncbi:MAG: tRNA uracil 4-sulfurtransferase ThiI [Chloroflexota bacterium]
MTLTSRRAVIHYAEVGLKGRNRPFFERALADNAAHRLEPLGVEDVERLPGRILARLAEPRDKAAWAKALGTVFGIAYFAVAFPAERHMDAVRATVLEHLPRHPVDSFRIRASRADKSFPLTSPDIERELGAAVQGQTDWPVQLNGPALEIGVEVLHDRVLITFGRVAGPGGLPVGVSGSVGLLLSGGIDSPVAGYLALKRGCQVTPIHFHSRPFGNWRGAEKRARKIVEVLRAYGMEPYFHAVRIGRQQREITVHAPAAFRVLLYRRLMVRVAEVLAHREGGKALVSGESLGQVASQTLEGLAATEDAATMPILRPLIGMDKQEIVNRAQAIGTFELSQMPADDCCRFLMPNTVVTRPRLEDVRKAEASVDMDRYVEEALEEATLIDVPPETT